ncbi:hypothetical protein ACQZ6F_06480, partial [Rhizobium sp. A22-96]
PTTSAMRFSGEFCASAELATATPAKTNIIAKNAQIVFLDDNPIIESKGDIPVSFRKHVAHCGDQQ